MINDGECSYRESQMVATWRPPSKKKSLLWSFWPEGGHQPNRASGVASDQFRGEACLALTSSIAAEYSSALWWACVLARRYKDSSNSKAS